MFRLELTEISRDVTYSSRKRPYTTLEKNEATIHNHRPSGVNTSVTSSGSWRSADLFFLPSTASPYQEYLLLLPRHLLKAACDAARFQYEVRIIRYSVLPICEKDGDTRKSVAILQVNHLETMEENGSGRSLGTSIDDDEIWTLAQFRRKEFIDYHDTALASTKKRYRVSLSATVESISPIIAMEPSDPFALVELYDKEFPSASCVVVLKGKAALSCHAGINPGDRIIFRDISRKQWKVPSTFRMKQDCRHLHNRIPSQVFVVTESSSVTWTTVNQKTAESWVHASPPTSEPLTCCKGEILRVKWILIPRGDTSVSTIHWIEVKQHPSHTNSSPCMLYLTYFPMSPSLQLSLRPGALVQAVNIHFLCHSPNATNTLIFAACLRSSLFLLRHAAFGEDKAFPLLTCSSQVLNNEFNRGNFVPGAPRSPEKS